ncbi:GAF domain-containing protein [Ruminiclostridium cellobioparum]|uniref:GAF domain-containing protein n=1 Tax=Ruminiclostridium cellobioparum TaxID=29355 RepID=UPI0028A624EC|nr:GAF domain-containing protein [Ruminiclostridium cellobioparum]
MRYQSILQRIEDEKKDEIISAKLYRYTGLVQAIDYFSQKLVFEQIIDAAFDFINELLLVDSSAIFVYENDGYYIKKVKGIAKKIGKIPVTTELGNLAAFNGNILYEREKIIKFFDPEIIDALAVNAAVPLIIEGNLYGFILFYNKSIGEDDFIISEALMRLINNALENFSRYEKLARVNSELDEKIFNLFAINQSSKILLSELRMDVLYSISVDVFSELTRSKITGFVLFDEKSEKFVLKSYKDVFYKTKDAHINLEPSKSAGIDQNKVIIDLGKAEDREYLNGLFDGASAQLEQLEAKYAVLILKQSQLLGLVTLSETVTGGEYSSGIFELIESLASSTYTALSNAMHFGLVNEQKALIQKKLDKLISLNSLTKNISSSIRMETLLETCTKTLQISFNTSKGAFCLYKKETNEFEIASTINLDNCSKKVITPNKKWKRIFEGDTVFAMGQQNLAGYVGESLAAEIGEAQGVLLIPVYIDMMDIEILGLMAVFKYDDIQLDNEENMLILETIAGSIAPVLNNLLMMQLQQRFMLPNYSEIFKSDLKGEIKQAIEYNLDLTVVQIIDEEGSLFKSSEIIDSLKESFSKLYPFSSNNIFIIENIDDRELEERIEKYTKGKKLFIRKMKLGTDFKSFAEFFNLYR